MHTVSAMQMNRGFRVKVIFRIPASLTRLGRLLLLCIEYQVKLQIVSLSMQIAGFSETPVPPFLQIGIKVFANPVSTFLQI